MILVKFEDCPTTATCHQWIDGLTYHVIIGPHTRYNWGNSSSLSESKNYRSLSNFRFRDSFGTGSFQCRRLTHCFRKFTAYCQREADPLSLRFSQSCPERSTLQVL